MGSSMYEFTEKQFPVFVEDVRKRNMHDHLEELDTSRRSSRLAAGAASAGFSSDSASQRKVY